MGWNHANLTLTERNHEERSNLLLTLFLLTPRLGDGVGLDPIDSRGVALLAGAVAPTPPRNRNRDCKMGSKKRQEKDWKVEDIVKPKGVRPSLYLFKFESHVPCQIDLISYVGFEI